MAHSFLFLFLYHEREHASGPLAVLSEPLALALMIIRKRKGLWAYDTSIGFHFNFLCQKKEKDKRSIED